MRFGWVICDKSVDEEEMRLQTVRNKERDLGSYWISVGPVAKSAPVLEMFQRSLCFYMRVI